MKHGWRAWRWIHFMFPPPCVPWSNGCRLALLCPYCLSFELISLWRSKRRCSSVWTDADKTRVNSNKVNCSSLSAVALFQPSKWECCWTFSFLWWLLKKKKLEWGKYLCETGNITSERFIVCVSAVVYTVKQLHVNGTQHSTSSMVLVWLSHRRDFANCWKESFCWLFSPSVNFRMSVTEMHMTWLEYGCGSSPLGDLHNARSLDNNRWPVWTVSGTVLGKCGIF